MMNHKLSVLLLVPLLLSVTATIGFSQDADQSFQQGLQAYFQEDYQTARQFFTRAIEDDTSSARRQFFLGNTLKQLGDTVGAIGQYKKTLTIEEGHQSARSKLADIYYEDGQWTKAQKQYQYLTERNPEKFEFQMRLGISHFKQNNLDKAKKRFLRARQLKPRSPEAHYYVGRVLMKRGEYLNAASRFDRAIDLNPSTGKYYFYRGLAYFREEDYLSRNDNSWQSARDFQKAIDHGFKSSRTRFMHANSLLNRGLNYIKEDRVEEAIKLLNNSLDQYRRVLSQDWRASNAFHNMAVAYLAIGKLRFAKKSAERAIMAEPDTPFFHDTLGEVYFRLGEFAKAIESWNFAQELDSSYQTHPFEPLFFSRSLSERIEEAKLRR